MDRSNGLERFGFLHDAQGRAGRARRIVNVLRDVEHAELATLRLLDVGCSSGLITRELARHVAMCVGLDMDLQAVAWAAANTGDAAVSYLSASGEALPFADASFDVVVCNHVYEHTKDAARLMAEILRVLAPRGLCWFAAGHTLQLIEPHYRLPLLSVLPRGVASAIVRVSGRGADYEVRFLPPWAVPRLFKGFAAARLVSIEVLRDSRRYGLDARPLKLPGVRALVAALAKPLAWLAPTQLWVLRKGGA